MQKANHSNTEIKNWSYFSIGLLASWLLAFLFFTMPFGFIIWLICLIPLFRNRSKLRWFLILFSGWVGLFTISFSMGVKDYFAGKAEFIGGGLPGPEVSSIDRRYRISSTSSGCILIGFELITNPSRNLAIKTCVTLFGYQKGSYTGYFPTREEVHTSIQSVNDSTQFSVEESTITFSWNGKEHHIHNKWRFESRHFPDSCCYAKITMLNDQVILFRPVCGDGYGMKYTMLANPVDENIFARYYDFMLPENQRVQ